MGDQKIIEIKGLNAAFGRIRTDKPKHHYSPFKLFHIYFERIKISIYILQTIVRIYIFSKIFLVLFHSIS